MNKISSLVVALLVLGFYVFIMYHQGPEKEHAEEAAVMCGIFFFSAMFDYIISVVSNARGRPVKGGLTEGRVYDVLYAGRQGPKYCGSDMRMQLVLLSLANHPETYRLHQLIVTDEDDIIIAGDSYVGTRNGLGSVSLKKVGGS